MEATRVFREFVNQCGYKSDPEMANVLVHCDGHNSLLKMCDDLDIKREIAPPKQPRANAIAERQIGIALDGIRAVLCSAGLPICFWPFAGHAFSFNDCCNKKGKVASAYETLMHNNNVHKDEERAIAPPAFKMP